MPPPGLASGHVPVQYMTLPGGLAGTDGTVDLMRQLAMGQYGSRSPNIRALAINILTQAGIAGKDYQGEMIAIHNWVRDNIRYTRDVAGQETLLPPEETAFNSKAGDCDDMSVLEAALLGSVGFDTRFKTIGVTPDRFSHVYLEAKLNDQWVPLDPIMKDKPAGWEAPANMVKLVKTYPENTTEDLNMSRTVNGLGFIADQRVVSHLSPDPTEEYVPGSEDPNAGSNGPGNYVVMDSMLDSDLPIEALSNNAPAFPMNAHYDQMAPPTAQRRDPQLYRMRSPYDTGAPAPAWVYDRIDQETNNQAGSEDAAGNPVQGLGYDIMGPDVLGAMAAGAGRGGRQRPVKNPQRPALAQTPEGIDKMFSRSAQVMNGKAGDRILYQGLTSLSERPPIRPATTMAGLGGVFGVGRGNGPMPGINGMGVLAGRSMSGPGMGDLSDLADDTAAALPPATTVPAPVVAPATIAGLPKGLVLAGLAGLALAWYLKSQKTSATKRFSAKSRGARAKHWKDKASSKDDFLLAH